MREDQREELFLIPDRRGYVHTPFTTTQLVAATQPRKDREQKTCQQHHKGFDLALLC